MERLVKRYTEFLSNNKTERSVIHYLKNVAEKEEWENIDTVSSLKKGKTYYKEDREKNFAVITYNGIDDIRGIGSHVDSPCLHLKPRPIQEKEGIGILRTHYYGGIRKYQWLNIPLTVQGVIYTEKGERVNVSDITVTIPDLLPHLSKEQRKKKLKKAVEGEQLNPILTVNDEDDVKEHILGLLEERYGVEEDDLVGADLRVVPAQKPVRTGLHKDLLLAYGHDDRSSVYTSLEALRDADTTKTNIAMFYDKEEIGSTGTTGAQNQFWTHLYEDIVDKTQHNVRPSKLWKNSKIISADVTSGYNPNFGDVHDTTNMNKVGNGVSIQKYGGSGGKYRTQDAGAEFTSQLINLMRKNNVDWQTGENGKIDVGGGGTIAMFIAQHGADVIDVGIPVLGMHAPMETASTEDITSAYKCFKVFYEERLSLK